MISVVAREREVAGELSLEVAKLAVQATTRGDGGAVLVGGQRLPASGDERERRGESRRGCGELGESRKK